jgi:HAE1 family hydrophobic/amphiphilic exporter-1
MALLSVMVIGALALARLPLAFLPSVDLPFIIVTVPYPNSSPTQVEKEIARPVEEGLATLPGVRKMVSRSTADAAEIELGFTWGQDLDVVRMRVSEKIHQVKPDLPEGIGDIAILSLNASDIPVIEGRIAAEGVDLSRNYDLLESRILNPIRRVPGVARVDLHGVAPREVRIELVRDKVKEHGVDIGRLFERLRGASSNVILGQVSEDGRRYSARALGVFDDLEVLGSLPIDERGLRLGEVADITYEEPPIAFGRHLEGDSAVALSVYKESTANTVEVVRSVMRVIREDIDRDPLLRGVRLMVWDDQAGQIVSSIHGLRGAGVIGALLAVGVLYFFLRRLDSTLIVSLSIPFSLLAACGVLRFMGRSLNILSMMGLMLGVGMLVDNAIVVLESIDRRSRAQQDSRRASLEGARDVALAVTASTLTTVIVFLPLIVGASTQLSTWLEEVGATITIALLCSLLSSLTLIPLLSVRLLRRRAPARNAAMEWLEERYAAALAWMLRRRGWMLALVIGGLVVGLAPFFAGWVETAQFAGVVHERLFLAYEFADFAYKSDSEAAVNRVEAYLRANRERFQVGTLYSYFGENEAGTVINLARRDLDDREVRELRKAVREGLPQIPGVRVFFREEADEGGGSNYFAVKLFGQDAAQLQRLSEITERRLAGIEGVRDISTPARKGRQEVQVTIDRERARQLGLTAKDVADIFSFTLGGLRLPRFNAGRREVETWLELRLEDRRNLDDLRRLQFTGRDGRPVMLGEIASFEIVKRPQEILREGRKVRAEVKAVYEGEDWEGAKKRIEEQMNGLDLPPGTTWSWDERILERSREDQQMMVNFALALVLVYIVMASLFESVTQPFAILFSIPFALPGIAWFLAATRTPFNLMGQIGLLMLVGIVVNNGIVLLDHLNQLRRAGMGAEKAIVQTGRDRLRAILMTAATTIVGLVPMALGSSGVGDAYYYPLARTVIGGLMSSTVLSLVVLPYINLGVERSAAWAARLWAASAPRRATEAIPAPH